MVLLKLHHHGKMCPNINTNALVHWSGKQTKTQCENFCGIPQSYKQIKTKSQVKLVSYQFSPPSLQPTDIKNWGCDPVRTTCDYRCSCFWVSLVKQEVIIS